MSPMAHPMPAAPAALTGWRQKAPCNGDTHKRLISIFDRQTGRKLPLVIHSWGESNLDVATSLGRILRDRGIDTTAGSTEVQACADKPEADCFALKRPG